MGTTVDPEASKITVDGKQIATETKRYYIALNKPVGYVSTVRDPHAEYKVTDLVQIPGARLVPVGRLDADTEGLLLMSNDGEFVYRVTHPSQSVGKTYIATVVGGKPIEETLIRVSKGLMMEGETRKTAPALAKYLGKGQERGTHDVELVLHEGRNRQVRRMLETVGHPVVRLVRVAIGSVELGLMAPGAWRELAWREVLSLVGADDESRYTTSRPPENRAGIMRSRRAGNGARPRPRPAGR